MKLVGLVLFGVGMLAGAYFLVEVPDLVRWEALGPSLGVAGLGVLAMRLAGGESEAAEVTQQGLQRAKDALVQLRRQMRARSEEAIPDYIDRALMPSLDAFVEARESIQRAHGLDAYAAVMDRFAQGERALNRSWAAGADGYAHESERSFAVALGRFDDASQALDSL
ncbi:MAG: hypothetical protein AAF851_19985 [Myxococcota bacterium]